MNDLAGVLVRNVLDVLECVKERRDDVLVILGEGTGEKIETLRTTVGDDEIGNTLAVRVGRRDHSWKHLVGHEVDQGGGVVDGDTLEVVVLRGITVDVRKVPCVATSPICLVIFLPRAVSNFSGLEDRLAWKA